jgi:hypothetical protein
MNMNAFAIPLLLALVGCDKPAKRAEPISCADAGKLLVQRKRAIVDGAPSDQRATLEGVISKTGGLQCVLDTWTRPSMDCFAEVAAAKNLETAAFDKRFDACLDTLGAEKKSSLDGALASAVDAVPKPAAAAKPAAVPATPVAAPAATADGRAFALGHDLGYVVFMRVRGANVDALFQAAERAAKELDYTLPPLPALDGDMPTNAAAALDYALDKTGEHLTKAVEARSGKRAAMLFDIALKSEVLRLLYIGDKDTLTDRIADTVEGGSRIAKLPPDLAKPLTDKVRKGAPPEEVEAAIDAWRVAVASHLDTAPEVAATPAKKRAAPKPAAPKPLPKAEPF